MKPKEWTIFVLTLVLISQLEGCILCPYRIPPKVGYLADEHLKTAFSQNLWTRCRYRQQRKLWKCRTGLCSCAKIKPGV